jgi:hypothetical protein
MNRAEQIDHSRRWSGSGGRLDAYLYPASLRLFTKLMYTVQH